MWRQLLAVSVLVVVTVSTSPVVTLPDGTSVTGAVASSGSVYTFLGIRYALPPVNERRWVPPEPWTNSEDSVNATQYGQACTQSKHGSLYGGEDCLFLNVFVHSSHFPIDTEEALPVAFWIHGGTYISGDGSQYDAQELINLYNGHVIIVTINYRLNIFGFLGSEDMRSLDPDHGSTGTLGFQDQRLAMRWVQDNIKSFGGDKDRVTLFGQSAGAGSISAHLTMEKSLGLFSAVIMESGGFDPWNVQNMTNVQKIYNNVLDEASCANLTCLQALSTTELYDIFINIDPATNFFPTAFIPAVDFVELHTHPWISVSAGNITNVPMLFGTNADEGVSYLPDTTPSDMSEFEFFYMLVVVLGFGDYRNEIEEIYVTNATYPVLSDDAGTQYSQYWWAAQRFVGDYFFTCPDQFALNELSYASGTPCSDSYCSDMFGYHNRYQISNRGLFVQHGYELPLVFHFEEHLPASEDIYMADAVATYWGHFFVAQNPSAITSGISFSTDENLPTWPHYDPDVGNVTIFSNDYIGMTSYLKKIECSLLNTILEDSMRKTFPHSFSDSASGSNDGGKSSSSIAEDFSSFGYLILIASVVVVAVTIYTYFQHYHGMTHEEAQRFLALRDMTRATSESADDDDTLQNADVVQL